MYLDWFSYNCFRVIRPAACQKFFICIFQLYFYTEHLQKCLSTVLYVFGIYIIYLSRFTVFYRKLSCLYDRLRFIYQIHFSFSGVFSEIFYLYEKCTFFSIYFYFYKACIISFHSAII